MSDVWPQLEHYRLVLHTSCFSLWKPTAHIRTLMSGSAGGKLREVGVYLDFFIGPNSQCGHIEQVSSLLFCITCSLIGLFLVDLSVVGYCWWVIRYGLKFSNSGIIWRANINSQLLIDINHQGSKGRLLRMTRTSWDSLHGYDQNEDRYIDNKGFANEVSGTNEEYSNEW